MVSHITWQLIIMITPGLSQKVAYLLACNRWGACIFLAKACEIGLLVAV